VATSAEKRRRGPWPGSGSWSEKLAVAPTTSTESETSRASVKRPRSGSVREGASRSNVLVSASHAQLCVKNGRRPSPVTAAGTHAPAGSSSRNTSACGPSEGDSPPATTSVPVPSTAPGTNAAAAYARRDGPVPTVVTSAYSPVSRSNVQTSSKFCDSSPGFSSPPNRYATVPSWASPKYARAGGASAGASSSSSYVPSPSVMRHGVESGPSRPNVPSRTASARSGWQTSRGNVASGVGSPSRAWTTGGLSPTSIR
jgi:hypothetical protein